MTKLTPTERASKGGQASTHRPFRDKPGAASAAAKVAWANMTPEQRSERASKASKAAAEKRTQAARNKKHWFDLPEFKRTKAAALARAKHLGLT